MRPRVLDLFSGCGGLSLGFAAAGFEIVTAMETDPLAARTHAENLHKGLPEDVIARHARTRDVSREDPEQIAREFYKGRPEDAFDIIIGGPPCQAYARIGRAKLRAVGEDPFAYTNDRRAGLYLRYLDYIHSLRPLALLMENVPDILNFGGRNIVEEMLSPLNRMGYEAAYSLINSAHHGVPQMRDRIYLIAFRKELGAVVRFPDASHRCDLPSGYMGMRSVALKLVGRGQGGGYQQADTGGGTLPTAVSAAEAIVDLPVIDGKRNGLVRRAARRFDNIVPYRMPANTDLSAFARKMRTWKGFEASDGIADHVTRALPRDTNIFRSMSPGDEYPAALAVAERLFEVAAEKSGLARNGSAWLELRQAMVPPYDPGKFPNRWWKLCEAQPVRTLTAHIGKDTYSHIHYDGRQGRVISVREAARLQSFPDGFRFAGAMNAAFRQIGNAVPPLMAKRLAEVMIKELRRSIRSRGAAVAVAAE